MERGVGRPRKFAVETERATARYPRSDLMELDALAAQEGKSRSDAMVEAVRDWIAKRRRKSRAPG